VNGILKKPLVKLWLLIIRKSYYLRCELTYVFSINIILQFMMAHFFKIPIFTLIGLFLPCLSGIVAQNWNEFTPLACQGPIPDDILKLASEKYEEQKDEINLNQERNVKVKSSKDQFLLQTNFVMHQLLQSGKVLFNDPLGNYCNQIKDYLLRDDPEMQAKIRIYIIKSPSVNAFATSNGIILVNVGLIACLKNESELAFVLCHEIQHFLRNHPLIEHVEASKINHDNPLYRGASLEKLVLAKNQYSRELETEADMLGFELYKSSIYSFNSIDGVYDLLQYAHLPFADISFEKEFLQTSNLVWPDEYWLDSVTPISPRDEYDSLTSTHPSLRERRGKLHELMKNLSDEGRQEFLFSEEKFLEIQKTARFEKTWLLLKTRDYENAIYSAYALLESEPKSLFLNQVIGQSLYRLARYRNEGHFQAVHESYVDWEGASQKLRYLIEKMDKAQLNALAVIWCWKVHEMRPEAKEFNLIVDNLLKDMVSYYRESAEKMVTTPRPTNLENPKDEFFKHAFADLLAKPDFKEKFDHYLNIKDEASASSASSGKENAIIKRRGYSLGIDKVIILDPLVIKVDERKAVQVQYIASEESEDEYRKLLEDNAKKADVEYEILDRSDLTPENIGLFNQYVLVNDWLGEFFEYPEVELVNLYSEETGEIINKFGTDKLLVNGNMYIRGRGKMLGKTLVLLLSCIYYPFVPLGVTYFIKPDVHTLYLTMVLDLEQNRLLMVEYKNIGYKSKVSRLTSMIYFSFLQIKRGNK
jgi:beta-barrel assembly-enhancing protease